MNDRTGNFSWARLLILVAAVTLIAGGTMGSVLIAFRLMK
jgi:hypothetical protein